MAKAHQTVAAPTTNSGIAATALPPYVHEVTTALARLAQESGFAELAFFLEMTALGAGDHARRGL